ncbi:hypothetical protein [Gimesia sp.]|uniref:hypothetical protein n=1 Tax=Gimesia sp. TaxID=2024833 RepID=UPI003A9079A8
MKYRMITTGAMALAMCVANISAYAADTTYDGKVSKVTDQSLVLTNSEGQEQTLTIQEDTIISLDGKTCELKDLTTGLKVRVTTEQGAEKIASIIEAIKSNETFANTHDGKFVSMSGKKFVMTDANGDEHSHTLMTNAKVTCDGKPCKMGALKAGMKIRVTTTKNNQKNVIQIEALDQNAKFV